MPNMPIALHPQTRPPTRPPTRPHTHPNTRPATHRPAKPGCSALVAALLLSGCASPYVRMSPASDVLAVQPQVLADAISTARAKQRDYHDQVINLGEAERALSNSLLGLGTLIVGLGVAKVHPSAISGAVLGTGAVYTIGTFNTDKRRAQVYVAGMKALDCAVDAVTPLVLSKAQEARLMEDRNTLAPAIAATAKAIGQAEQWAARARIANASRFKDTLDAIQQALPAAQAAVDKAGEAAALAGQRLDKPQQIAADLHGAVRAIDRAVLDDIRGTENAVQAVAGILAGLQGNASLFSLAALAPGLVPAPAGKAGAPSPMASAVSKEGGDTSLQDAIVRRDQAILKGLTDALGTLRSSTVQLASQADQLSRAAAMTTPQAVSTTLKTCQVDGVLKPISVAPGTVTLVAKTASTQSLLVDGGNGEFSAYFLQSPAPGLTAIRPPRSKGVVNVVATDQTVAGSYPLVIEDSTQQTRQIVTVVVGAAMPGDTPAADSKKPTMTDAEAAAAKLNAAGALTTANKVKVTGLKATALDALTVELSYQAAADAQVTDDEVAAAGLQLAGVGNLLGNDPQRLRTQRSDAAPHSKTVKKTSNTANPAATVGKTVVPAKSASSTGAGPIVRSMTSAEIRALQIRLCLPKNAATGIWTAQTQAALEADRARRLPAAGPVPAAGEALGALEQQRLQALSEADASKRCSSK